MQDVSGNLLEVGDDVVYTSASSSMSPTLHHGRIVGFKGERAKIEHMASLFRVGHDFRRPDQIQKKFRN